MVKDMGGNRIRTDKITNRHVMVNDGRKQANA
jgi:hypothetical protein